MKKIVWLAVFSILLSLIGGCAAGKSKYVGTWKLEAGMFGITIVLNKDGTGNVGGAFGGDNLRWRVDGDKIIITEPNRSNEPSVEGKLSDDGKSLIVKAGNETNIYLRQ